jgi:hypothetical protein
MPTVTLKAHYDGQRIVLDEPFDLPTDAPLIVTVLPNSADPVTQERSDWAVVAAENLSRGYGSEEPDYTLADIKERS